MVNTWIEKLKIFNKDGNVWAIPRKQTAERKLLDDGKQFRYTLALHGTPMVSKTSMSAKASASVKAPEKSDKKKKRKVRKEISIDEYSDSKVFGL
jgi:hypothetical protein